MHAAETKKSISCAMSAHRACIPVFTFAKRKFSHGMTLLILSSTEDFLHYNINVFQAKDTESCCLISPVPSHC